MIDEMSGLVGHATSGTRWSESATPAREWHEARMPAGGAAKTGEAVSEDPASQEGAQLVLDEPWELPITGFGPLDEGLEVGPKDPVEHRGLGTASLLIAPARWHRAR